MIQPLVKHEGGVIRFKANAVVRYLLDNGGINMNDLARLDFSIEDREQFAMLIGYSLSGFGDLSYVRDETYGAAERMVSHGESEADARIRYLEGELQALKEGLRESVARLYGIAPEDLNGE